MAALARRCFANRCDDRALLADVVDGALTPGGADASYGDGDNTVNLAAGEFHSRYFVHKLRYIQHPINYLFGGWRIRKLWECGKPTYFKDQPRLAGKASAEKHQILDGIGEPISNCTCRPVPFPWDMLLGRKSIDMVQEIRFGMIKLSLIYINMRHHYIYVYIYIYISLIWEKIYIINMWYIYIFFLSLSLDMWYDSMISMI